MTKDYYEILGVTEFETAEEIKKAYRQLARKLHPDVAGNNASTLAKFKEINEAYEVLSNKVKKEEYDKARKFYSYARQNSKRSEEAKKQDKNVENPNTRKEERKRSQINFNWQEFVSKRMWEKTSTKKENRTTPKKGEDIYADVEITAFEGINGVSKTINMLQTQVCPVCGGRKFVNGNECSHCKGKGEFTDYKRFTVKIPAGIKNNSKIRLAGEGGKGINGGYDGDLYITVHVKPNQNYKQEGLNILKTLPITPYEAVLGGYVEVEGLSEKFKVKLSPNTQNGQKIRLSGCGVVQNGKIGDMILTVEIRIPKQLSEEERMLYKKLEEISSVRNSRDSLYD